MRILDGILAYCATYENWVDAQKVLQTYGAELKSPQGYPIRSPYLAIANRQTDIMLRIAAEFGFTPASRPQAAEILRSNPSIIQIVFEKFLSTLLCIDAA